MTFCADAINAVLVATYNFRRLLAWLALLLSMLAIALAGQNRSRSGLVAA